MLRVLASPRLSLSAFRRLSSALSPEASEEFRRVSAALTEALEGTLYISDSAQQAYLETDPSHRGLPETFLLRYLGFARAEVDAALRQYDTLRDRLGAETMQDVEQREEKFSLAVADTLLARDRLTAQIRANETSMEQKKADGLSRKDLTFCD